MLRLLVPAIWSCAVAFFTPALMAAGHPWGEEKLTPKEIASYYDAAFLAGEWYLNTQNTQENPWGGIHDSADLGRFIYEYYPARRWARGNVVWGQAPPAAFLIRADRAAVEPAAGHVEHLAEFAGVDDSP